MARIAVLLAVAVLAAAPAAALAAAPPDPTQSPFQQAPSQNQVGGTPIETPAPQQQTQADDGSISAVELLLVGIGVVALIGGIWFVIARDAKRATAGRVPAADSAFGASATRTSRRSRRLSSGERRRRKRGRATK